MSSQRLPFPQFNEFRSFVYDELSRRKQSYGAGIATPFVRMTSACVDDSTSTPYRNLSLGLHGFTDDQVNIFDLTYGLSKNGLVGMAYGLDTVNENGESAKIRVTSDMLSTDYSAFAGESVETMRRDADAHLTEVLASAPTVSHPVPGITNISVVRRGLGEPMIATVNWQCYNRAQLEFLRNHFLIPGNFVVLEYGQQFVDALHVDINSMVPFQNPTRLQHDLLQIVGATERSTSLFDLFGRAYVIQNYNEPNGGNYDAIVGQVSNFEITFEPETNIYKCVTKIVSQGENLWGITLDYTSQPAGERNSRITTIHEYFDSNMYDAFLEKHLGKGVIQMTGTGFQKNTTESTYVKQSGLISQNIHDYAFVTWSFLFTNLLLDMLSIIQNDTIRTQILEFMRFAELEESDYVGYHPKLRSAEPETLILITPEIMPACQGDLNKFVSAGLFGDDAERRGKLTSGVWINTGAIRQSFLTASDLRQAIHSLLIRMNRGTGAYWQLQLFFDEENAKYKIIDFKYGDQARNRSFYKFNVGGTGETLSVEFDAAFPPELISQMMLVARFKTASSEEQASLVAHYPLLGTTSAHMYVINWTNLQDALQNDIQAFFKNKVAPKGPVDSYVNMQRNLVSPATSWRISDLGLSGAGLTSGDKVRAAGETVSELSAIPARDNPIAAYLPVRDSVKPVPLDPQEPNKNLSLLDTDFRAQISKLILRLHQEGWTVNIGEAYRPQARQNILYGQGRTTPGKVVTWTQDSAHIRGAAVDLVVYKNPKDTGASEGYEFMHRLIADNQADWPLLQTLNSRYPSGGLKDGGHVQRIDYKQLARKEIPTGAIDDVGTSGNPPAKTTNQPNGTIPLSNDPVQEAARIKQEATIKRRGEVTAKFGNAMMFLIAAHRGDMINEIIHDGYGALDKPNSFVAPFPTSTSVTVEIQGIAGISISDGFFVDKIPFLFEKHGVFQVTEIIDTVTIRGWRTKIKGYFKMLWYDGKGNATKKF